MLRIKAEDGAGYDPVTGKNIYVERIAPQISTYMRPYWANAVQEEIANTIEADGTALNEADNKQLLRAVKFPHAIRTNLTLVYGTDFVNLNQAFDLLRGRYIAPGVTVTINLGSGYPHVINITSPVVVDHPQGSQIQVIGDVTTPENTVLSFTTTNIPGYRGAIEIAPGCTLGLMDGFQMAETYVSQPQPRYYIKLTDRSSLYLGSNVILTEIAGSAIKVDNGSFLKTGAITVRNFAQMFGVSVEPTGVGIFVTNRSTAICDGIKMTNAPDIGLNGIHARLGSSVVVSFGDFSNSPVTLTEGSTGKFTSTNSHSTLTGKNAFSILYGSNARFSACKAGDVGKDVNGYGFYLAMASARFENCQASYCNMGFFLENSSRASLNVSCSSNNNVNYGYYAIEGSYAGNNATGTGNGVARIQKDTTSTIIPA